MATIKVPRGIRNNNPLNIRIGNRWQGEVKHSTDKSFEQFISMEWGIRAAFIILRRYIRRYGRNTIARIVAAWAPSNENNTRAYVLAVSRRSRLDYNLPIRYEDEDVMCAIVSAMIEVECGQSVSMDIIKKGYSMA